MVRFGSLLRRRCWKQFQQKAVDSYSRNRRKSQIMQTKVSYCSSAASWRELLGENNGWRLMDDKTSRLVRNRALLLPFGLHRLQQYNNRETICMLLRIERKLSDWLFVRSPAIWRSLNFRSAISSTLINLNSHALVRDFQAASSTSRVNRLKRCLTLTFHSRFVNALQTYCKAPV